MQLSISTKEAAHHNRGMEEYHPPVLNLSELSGKSISPEALSLAASKFDEAMREQGVLYVKNSGVSQELIDTIRRKALNLFKTGDMNKSDAETYGAEGYTGVGREMVGTSQTNAETPRDNVESLILYSINSAACPTELRAEIGEYFEHTTRIMLIMVKLMAYALKEAPLTELFDDQGHTLKLSHYPSNASGTQGYGAHKDYGGFTILAQDDSTVQGSLQIFKDNEWFVVPPKKSHLLINAGELIERWTNGVYKSPLHRVALAPNRTDSRLSIVYFSGPKSDTVVSPLKQCCSRQSPSKYKPVVSHQWILHKLSLNNGNFTNNNVTS